METDGKAGKGCLSRLLMVVMPVGDPLLVLLKLLRCREETPKDNSSPRSNRPRDKNSYNNYDPTLFSLGGSPGARRASRSEWSPIPDVTHVKGRPPAS